MPKAAAEHRVNITLTTTAEMGAKVDRVVARVGTSKNAVILGLLHALSEDEIERHYLAAVNAGAVSPRGKVNPKQRKIMQALSRLSPEKLAELSTWVDGLPESSDGNH